MYLGSMTSNDDPESTAEEREKEVPGFEMTNMPLHLQLYHSFLQVHMESILYSTLNYEISDVTHGIDSLFNFRCLHVWLLFNFVYLLKEVMM